ncbi:hypothetical protein NQ117_05365 [Paenibacillus sp. SC116]|uniref:hypothetical protein n=1 Tax=Paenibacillus sp. SC116 TaxID=2968986 RepID=UPI00215A4105|nr:hypothetical protein [Paenibacillus sp. SC116]MCR8843101.1 hypothetical protein [Paenibacillus sp. SC116]
MKTFRGDSDYKAAFEQVVMFLINEENEDRTERMADIQALIDEYVDDIGETPNASILEKLTDYILREELLDPNPYKVAHNEYPILSERQMSDRYEREYALDLAENHDTDGVNRAAPVKRRRTAKEARFVDKLARIKNRSRKAQYKRDTSPGDEVSYNLRDTGGAFADEFVNSRGLGVAWASGAFQT